ncbi:hypothetical protein C1H46_031896 [Malus baccata]|uniref:Uncharacterized protein n=1 Tax=Malus baccata TaxID=106549 RepID=A0A540L7W6_MALBA|nr:hypothetical protein C1H46_031896 [Malus baccata]
MKNLQVLFVNSNVRLSGEIDYFPNELRLLHWHEYPSQVLPKWKLQTWESEIEVSVLTHLHAKNVHKSVDKMEEVAKEVFGLVRMHLHVV